MANIASKKGASLIWFGGALGRFVVWRRELQAKGLSTRWFIIIATMARPDYTRHGTPADTTTQETQIDASSTQKGRSLACHQDTIFSVSTGFTIARAGARTSVSNLCVTRHGESNESKFLLDCVR